MQSCIDLFYNKSMATDKKKKIKKALQNQRAVMGLLRKSHFEAGGDLASWRGRSNVYIDRKKKNNKYACRKRQQGEQ